MPNPIRPATADDLIKQMAEIQRLEKAQQDLNQTAQRLGLTIQQQADAQAALNEELRKARVSFGFVEVVTERTGKVTRGFLEHIQKLTQAVTAVTRPFARRRWPSPALRGPGSPAPARPAS